MLALLMGVLFLLVGAGGMIGSWGAYVTDRSIEESGPRARGHLVKKLFLGAADGDSDYVLEYWFETSEHKVLNASRTVDKELWVSLREGEPLEIRYSDANPKRNFPAGAGVTSFGVTVFVSAIAFLFAVFGGAIVWGFFRTGRPEA